MSLMTAVRNAISTSHDAIEQTPFSIAMMDGSMTLDDYTRGLVQLRHIHDVLETNLLRCEHAASVFTQEMIRTATIDRDLMSLGASRNAIPVLPHTATIVDQLRRWGSSGSVALLGCLYVLEGSRMGSLVIAKPLAKTLGLTSGNVAGIEYHTEGASQTPARVRQMKERIDVLALSEKEQADLTHGAVRFMDLLNQLYASLPVGSGPKPVAASKCPFSRAIGHVFGRGHLKSA